MLSITVKFTVVVYSFSHISALCTNNSAHGGMSRNTESSLIYLFKNASDSI